MSPAKIDAILRGLKLFGPYGIVLAFGLLGASMFVLGGVAPASEGRDLPGQIMRWSGAALSLLSVLAFGLWHFRQWPPWLVTSSEATSRPKARSRTVH